MRLRGTRGKGTAVTKAKLNLIIDALMALLLAAIAGLGFLINWVLIPGEQRPAVYGSRPDLYWLGWDRHQWGDVHLVLGIALLALTVLHVALHWSQVVGIWRRMVGSRVARVALAVVLLVLIAALMVLPALVTPEVVPGGHGGAGGHGGGAGRGAGALEREGQNAERETNTSATDNREHRGRGSGRGWRSERKHPSP